MPHASIRLATTAVFALAATSLGEATRAQTVRAADDGPRVTIPAHTGYAYPEPDQCERRPDGTVRSCEGALVFYVHIAHPGELHLTLRRTAGGPAARLQTTIDANPTPARGPATGSHVAADQTEIDLGTLGVVAAGWHRIGLMNVDGALHNLHSLELSGTAAKDLHANTAERRNAASVHLGYDVPAAARDDVEWFYIELTPKTDPTWTYYMATGWHRGYFGMQVNSESERRLIFSVWDAGGEAKDRAKVTAADRVTLVAKGDRVVASDFGNEGTGGHSHLVHPWRLGDTFRFLLHARVDGDATIYSGWFWIAERQQWGLIASFRAPKDGKRPRGLYSFSENFHGANGDLARECEFGNAWVRTAAGEQVALRQAHFTHDETGKSVRRDRWAGVRGDRFYLHHGDFVAPPDGAVTRARALLALPPTDTRPPEVALPTPPGQEKNR